MNPMQITRLTRIVCILGLLAVLGTAGAQAQNAAQQAALAKLNSAHVKAEGGPPNGVEATTVGLDRPGGLAFDSAGNLYIADTDDNLILEINLVGVISTVAGTGEQGFGGDGGPATAALLDSPVGLAVDSAGNIYIGDTHNQRVREVVVATGNIATIAGNGTTGFTGDGSTATLAELSYPTAVAVDSKDNVYIADTNNHRIREITGTIINTVAGDGEQFFSGDGGLATAAGLDAPNGVAVDTAFNLYIGDTHNQRVRMVTFSTGLISTLAGTGVKGFADGPAGSSVLARPRGVALDSSGNVYFADSDNQRIRSISGGTVATTAGNGTEGFSGDTGSSTSASLDTPRTLALFSTSIAFADTANNRVRTLTNGTLNTIGGQAPAQSEIIALGGPSSVVYGTGTLTAIFSNGTNTATGPVTFLDGLTSPAVVGTALLTGNTASLNTSLLAVGTHYIVASYAGDGNNPATVSGVYVLVVTPVQLTALANPVSLLYGQPIPTLTGTLNTVLAQDAGKVTATFATAATITSAPATYPITVSLSGSSAANYTVVLGATSGSVAIAKAPSNIALSSSSATPIFGTSLTLTATVTSTTTGTPGGTVSFYNGVTLLNTTPATVSGGVATFSLTTLPIGAQSLTAVYSGDTNFLTKTSLALPENVLPPDFTMTATPAVQTVLPLASVNYTLTLTPQNPTFVYPVGLSTSVLPTGITASFAPSSINTGAGTSTVVMTLSASGLAELRSAPLRGWPTALALLMLPLVFTRRMRQGARRLSRAGKTLLALLALVMASSLMACGGGGFFSHSTQSYTVTVTAVSGPVIHTTNVTLTVQ